MIKKLMAFTMAVTTGTLGPSLAHARPGQEVQSTLTYNCGARMDIKIGDRAGILADETLIGQLAQSTANLYHSKANQVLQVVIDGDKAYIRDQINISKVYVNPDFVMQAVTPGVSALGYRFNFFQTPGYTKNGPAVLDKGGFPLAEKDRSWTFAQAEKIGLLMAGDLSFIVACTRPDKERDLDVSTDGYKLFFAKLKQLSDNGSINFFEKPALFPAFNEILNTHGLFTTDRQFITGQQVALIGGMTAATALIYGQRLMAVLATLAARNSAAALMLFPDVESRAIEIDLAAVGLSLEQVKYFFEDDGLSQRSKCSQPAFKSFCRAMGEVEFKLQLSQGNAT